MAIEIESGSKQKKSNIINHSLYSGIVVLLLLGLIYGFLHFSIGRAGKKLVNLKAQFDEQIDKEDKALEEKINKAQEKINRSGQIIKNHKASSEFFDFLEKNTHPKLRFDKVNLNVSNSRIKLDGVADNFSVLGQQVNLLQKKEVTKDVKVSRAKLISAGKVGFSILIKLNPDIFNFS